MTPSPHPPTPTGNGARKIRENNYISINGSCCDRSFEGAAGAAAAAAAAAAHLAPLGGRKLVTANRKLYPGPAANKRLTAHRDADWFLFLPIVILHPRRRREPEISASPGEPD